MINFLIECFLLTCCLYEICLCGLFGYDIIKNDCNCCKFKSELEYVIVENENRYPNFIPREEINIGSIFSGMPKPENEIIN